ncbi:hypothetical protein CW304_22085 [Bacillus sp. UFRGS-B20]|nr:hypothetical protein CW304_22085 [Bacillus sp. UFRGS-B20]
MTIILDTTEEKRNFFMLFLFFPSTTTETPVEEVANAKWAELAFHPSLTSISYVGIGKRK